VGGELSRHPRYLLESLSSDEFADWLAYRKLFPSPQSRADINTALVRHSVLTPHSKKALNAGDFLPKYGVKKRRQTDKELAEKARLWCEAAKRLSDSGKIAW